MKVISGYVLLLVLLWSSATVAVERVKVLALFPGKAMLEIDGSRKVMSEGQQHISGITLVEANPRYARVKMYGEIRKLTLGTTVSGSYAKPKGPRELRLIRRGDAFHVDGLINGHKVTMLVDTGATSVAMSETQARRLGIPYLLENNQIGIGTASGQARGYRVTLKSLKIGDQQFRNVKAAVVEGDSPRQVLLGMNVLGRFDIEHKNNLMILRSKY